MGDAYRWHMRGDVAVHWSMNWDVFVDVVALAHPASVLLMSPQLHSSVLKPSLHLQTQ